MKHEQRLVQKAMDATFENKMGDTRLIEEVFQIKNGIRLRRYPVIAVIVASILICSVGFAALVVPSIKDVLPWYINEEKIVKPVSFTHNSEWLKLEVTEVYFSEQGLHLMFKMDTVNKDQLLVSDYDFLDKYPYRTFMDGDVHIDEWRCGKEVLLVHYLDIKHDAGWHSAKRVDNTLYMDVSSDDMLMRKDQLAKGIVFDVFGYVENLQSKEVEKFSGVIELPPLEMQAAEWKSK